MSWWSRRCLVKQPFYVFSSYYLVPAVALLGFIKIDTLVPLVTVLIIVGCVTTVMSHFQGKNSSLDVFLTLVGHMLPFLAYRDRRLPRESLYPSLAVLSVVFAVYRAANFWPYSVSPLEFLVFSLIGFAVYDAIKE